MTAESAVCNVECHENIAILTPRENLGELVYEGFEAVVRNTLDMLDNGNVKHVVVDFDHTKHFGSNAITLLIKLGNTTRTQGGKMALARLSPQGQEILKVTKLDTFWPTYSSREEAIQAVKT